MTCPGQTTTGSTRTGLDLHRSLAPQVAILPVALQTGGRSRLASALPSPAGDRSLVAEDRSAEGVRDHTGPASLTHAIPWGSPCRRSRWPSPGTDETIGHHRGGRQMPTGQSMVELPHARIPGGPKTLVILEGLTLRTRHRPGVPCGCCGGRTSATPATTPSTR
jgi:hypothetical protein